MKKRIAVLASVALAGALAVTAAGCGSQSRNLASLSSNWYYDAAFKNIQPTFTEDAAEKLTYKVTQAEESHNGYYSVSHSNGTYTTIFYAKKITETELKSITAPEWYDDYLSALGSDGYMYVYYYRTELSIPSVTFKYGQNTATLENQSVVSESYFLSVADYLSPVYTKRTVHRAVPTEFQVNSLERCYSEIDMEYESFYTLSGSNVKSSICDLSQENAEPKTYSVGGLTGYSNSVFDYTYLDIVVRAMRGLFASSGLTITLYTPGLQPRDYTVSVSDKALLDDREKSDAQLAEVQKLLEAKGMFTPKPIENSQTGETTKLKTKAASVAYNGGNYSGVSQTYWFAIGENNEAKTVMVKYSEPLNYNLGRLDYVLIDIG